MAKLKLIFKDRFVMSQILPQKGSILDLTIRKDLLDKVNFSAEEIKIANIREEDDGRVFWKDENTEGLGKDIEITKAELELLVSQVEKLDKDGNVTADIFDLCVKIREYDRESKRPPVKTIPKKRK
ncbi:MAG: hypothetical protein ACXABY_14925 [Candidatus Thorarchaeota archaeon]|jgi:hypothetical protein